MGSLRERRCCICDGGSVRGSSEAEMGLVAWIEGREERLGLRENEEKKKERRQRQRCRRERKSEPEKKRRRGKTSRDKHEKGSGWEGK